MSRTLTVFAAFIVVFGSVSRTTSADGILVVRVMDMGTKPPKPIPGATVSIGQGVNPNDPRTDADGRWEKRGLTPGKPVVITYRKNTYLNDPQQSRPLTPDGTVYEVYLKRPDESAGYYIQVAAVIRMIAEPADEAKKKEIYASEWAQLSSLSDDKLKIIGNELSKTTKKDDLSLIPRTGRNLMAFEPASMNNRGNKVN